MKPDQPGVRQYVVLGAGLDTFAYRSPRPAGSGITFDYMLPPSRLS